MSVRASESTASSVVNSPMMILPPKIKSEHVTSIAAKWSANANVVYDDFSYHVDLLKEEAAASSPNGKVEVTVIAAATEDGLKISLAENPLGGADFFKVEQGFADGAGSITAIVSRQHIEDAVSAVLMILPFTAILCMVISVLFALAYSRMFTRPIQQISAATEKMRIGACRPMSKRYAG